MRLAETPIEKWTDKQLLRAARDRECPKWNHAWMELYRRFAGYIQRKLESCLSREFSYGTVDIGEEAKDGTGIVFERLRQVLSDSRYAEVEHPRALLDVVIRYVCLEFRSKLRHTVYRTVTAETRKCDDEDLGMALEAEVLLDSEGGQEADHMDTEEQLRRVRALLESLKQNEPRAYKAFLLNVQDSKPKQIAPLLGVHDTTVWRWCRWIRCYLNYVIRGRSADQIAHDLEMKASEVEKGIQVVAKWAKQVE